MAYYGKYGDKSKCSFHIESVRYMNSVEHNGSSEKKYYDRSEAYRYGKKEITNEYSDSEWRIIRTFNCLEENLYNYLSETYKKYVKISLDTGSSCIYPKKYLPKIVEFLHYLGIYIDQSCPNQSRLISDFFALLCSHVEKSINKRSKWIRQRIGVYVVSIIDFRNNMICYLHSLLAKLKDRNNQIGLHLKSNCERYKFLEHYIDKLYSTTNINKSLCLEEIEKYSAYFMRYFRSEYKNKE